MERRFYAWSIMYDDYVGSSTFHTFYSKAASIEGVWRSLAHSSYKKDFVEGMPYHLYEMICGSVVRYEPVSLAFWTGSSFRA